MKRKFLLTVILFIMFLLFGVKVQANQIEKTVTNWTELKQAIEDDTESNLKIYLSDSNSNSWTANSTITIDRDKDVTIIGNANISITRDSNFKKEFIKNCGNLTIGTVDDTKTIIFDGNGFKLDRGVLVENIIANEAIIKSYYGCLNIDNVTLQNNNNANGYGGAMFIFATKLVCENSEILNNVADLRWRY